MIKCCNINMNNIETECENESIHERYWYNLIDLYENK